MTSTELAEKIGLSTVNLSNLKTGKVKGVRFTTLDAICKALDCQPGDLLEYLPGDKTGRAVGDEAGTAEADEITGDTVFAALEAAGIDTDKGMVFCQGDEELYKEILVEYARDHAERSGKLKECYASEDWKDYHIYAHSLKSSSKTIGAMRLSSLAEGLEKASQAQDAEAVRHDHAEAMELYEKTASVIKERLMQDAEEGLAAELIHFDPVEEDQV